MKRFLTASLVLLLAMLACAALLVAALLHALKPAPGDWTHTLRWGPWSRDVSMPALLRIATHPFTLRVLEGRRFDTRHGSVQWQATDTLDHWRAVCAPCSLPAGALGQDTIRLSRVEFTVARDKDMALQGRFSLGEGPQALHGRWSSQLAAARVEIRFDVTDEPIARVFALFAADIPELPRARIDGRLTATARWQLPSREWTVRPRIDGFRVEGLGTEALLHATPACGPAADPGTWLPRAVIAAEDQRFHDHPGYELQEMVSAWFANRRAGEVTHGASTLSQQLAKLVYTGDSRHHGRKLRELLYAVELDRTLGKARLLQLYLAVVPWGDGRCGAEAASRHLLGKPAAALAPMEATWLATLLHNPDRELARLSRHGEFDRLRFVWMVDQLRPVPPRQRAALLRAAEGWTPPRRAREVAMTVSATRAADGH